MTRAMTILGVLVLACVAGCGGSDEPPSLCAGFGLAACDERDPESICVNPLYAVCAFNADGSISGVIISFDFDRTEPMSCAEAEIGGACLDGSVAVCLDDASQGDSAVTRVACE